MGGMNGFIVENGIIAGWPDAYFKPGKTLRERVKHEDPRALRESEEPRRRTGQQPETDGYHIF